MKLSKKYKTTFKKKNTKIEQAISDASGRQCPDFLEPIIAKKCENIIDGFSLEPIKIANNPLYVVAIRVINKEASVWTFLEKEWDIKYLIEIIKDAYKQEILMDDTPSILKIDPKDIQQIDTPSILKIDPKAIQQIEQAFKTKEQLILDGNSQHIDLANFIYILVGTLITIDHYGGKISPLLTFAINVQNSHYQIQYQGQIKKVEWIEKIPPKEIKYKTELKNMDDGREVLKKAYQLKFSYDAFQKIKDFIREGAEILPDFTHLHNSSIDLQVEVICKILNIIEKNNDPQKKGRTLTLIKYTQHNKILDLWDNAWIAVAEKEWEGQNQYKALIKKIFILRHKKIDKQINKYRDTFKTDIIDFKHLMFLKDLPYEPLRHNSKKIETVDNNEIKHPFGITDTKEKEPFLLKKVIQFLNENKQIWDGQHFDDIRTILNISKNNTVYDVLIDKNLNYRTEENDEKNIYHLIYHFILLKMVLYITIKDYNLVQTNYLSDNSYSHENLILIHNEISKIHTDFSKFLKGKEQSINTKKIIKNIAKINIDQPTLETYITIITEGQKEYKLFNKILMPLEQAFIYILMKQYIDIHSEEIKFEDLLEFLVKPHSINLQKIATTYAKNNPTKMDAYLCLVATNKQAEKRWIDSLLQNRSFIQGLITFDNNSSFLPKFVSNYIDP